MPKPSACIRDLIEQAFIERHPEGPVAWMKNLTPDQFIRLLSLIIPRPPQLVLSQSQSIDGADGRTRVTVQTVQEIQALVAQAMAMPCIPSLAKAGRLPMIDATPAEAVIEPAVELDGGAGI